MFKQESFRLRAIFVVIAILVLPILSHGQTFETEDSLLAEHVIFSDDHINFKPDNPDSGAREQITVLDNGRVIQNSMTLPTIEQPTRIVGHLILKPIPVDDITVGDKWDRAGSIRLSFDDRPDLELVKFITAYGGQTEWEVDLSKLGPMLQGDVTISAFIDTWVTPGWLVDFSIKYYDDSTLSTPHWVKPIFFENSFSLEKYSDTGVTINVTIPDDQQRVMLGYLVSGHCTDGRGADEFVKKDNVISVDGVVIYRFAPWRDDCRDFREFNPYTRRWSDSYWSSDYDRSGWCPGDFVEPLYLDLTDHLTPGDHSVSIVIENIRPKNEDNHYGYWRVSSYLLGLTD
ncbi:MAG: peptide-N-glycosidase F-related protein [candidate division Zixibacteria bacterium]